MTPRSKQAVQAAFWFVAGFVFHGVLIFLHHHPQ